jgi:DNA-directed RNA polymerase specialized sigma24 family protein
MAKAKSKKEHYVNNKEFLEALIEYRKTCNDAEAQGNDKPPVTRYIGECFLKIAQHLSYRPNFINYTYKHDMISDGIENCLMYLHNFNPEKSKNPFAYFTQIIYYAFLRRIQKEKKQTELKQKLIQNMMVDESLIQADHDDAQYTNQYLEFLQDNMHDNNSLLRSQDEQYNENEPEVKKRKVRKGALDEFMGE